MYKMSAYSELGGFRVGISEQINIFQLGFQIKPTVSLIIILAITPALVYSILNIMEGVMKQLLELLSLMQVTI